MANNLDTEKKVLAVSMLAEGNSIRSIERITGVHRDTIMRLGVRVGQACAKIQDDKLRGLIAFYEQALKPLGIVHVIDYDGKDGPRPPRLTPVLSV
jgi:hypothetical protein